ncbi:hypothetical protein JCM20301_35800 [Pseudomonas aeruginosa]|nr:outer membrane porin, OprD family [Pseudomonas aeruginosa]
MHPTPRLAAALLAGSGLGWPLLAQADLVEDSHASLELRNFYFNRDFRQSGATVRSNFANDLDENRLILSYSLTLW